MLGCIWNGWRLMGFENIKIEDGRNKKTARNCSLAGFFMAGATRLELATSGLTARRSNQLNYAPAYSIVLGRGASIEPLPFCGGRYKI